MEKWLMGILLAFASSAGWAQVDVSGAWVRATVLGQMGTGAFMTLRAATDTRLVGAASAVAGVVEIHEMTMEGNVMRMRAIPALDLPAGRNVELKPGGFHVMLMDLKRPLKDGEKIAVDLQLETVDKRRVTQPVQVEVRQRPPGGASPGVMNKH